MKLLKEETIAQNAITRESKQRRREDSCSATSSQYFQDQTRSRALMLVRAFLTGKPRSAVESNPQPMSWGTYTNLYGQLQLMSLDSMSLGSFKDWVNAPVTES